MNISDKVSIVTGASSGLGKAFSEALVHQGAAVVYGLARSSDKLEIIRDELGNRFQPVPMDITDLESIEEWVMETFSDDNEPDILINNAGLAIFSNIEDLTLYEWHSMVETNLNGTFYTTRQLIPYMKDNENVCHIINISSIAGKVAGPKMTGYNASKFGVRGFTEALFQEVRYDGIKVTSFCPGSSDTHFFDRIEGAEANENMLQASSVADQVTDVIETPDNFLIDEIIMRPLNPQPPEK
jgi:NADP-dependent 3-hydroxy acid dehydrogenase YdfG